MRYGIFLALLFTGLTILSTQNADAAGSETVYACTLQGTADDNFDKNIRLELTKDNRFLTFYGNDGENCNGQFDPNYRQKPTLIGKAEATATTQFYRFYTDCEREDGFIQILISDRLYRAETEGVLKMRIRGAFFHQRYYDCQSL